MFISVMLFCIINLLCDYSYDRQYLVIKLFALLELSGVLIQLYRIDLTYFEKDLFDNKVSISLFLYLLKVDFWIFDYQYIYIMCFFILLLMYLICKKFINYCKKRTF